MQTMHFREFDTQEVKDAIESLAQEVADDDEWCEGVGLWVRTYEKVSNWCSYPIDHIMLCAYYAPNDCSYGYESYEDSPIAQFENDVYDRAVEIRGGDES